MKNLTLPAFFIGGCAGMVFTMIVLSMVGYSDCPDSPDAVVDTVTDTLVYWMAQMDVEGYIYPCSSMVTAVESCVDPVTRTWGAASTDPDPAHNWTVTDTLYWIFDREYWDSLKQARGL